MLSMNRAKTVERPPQRAPTEPPPGEDIETRLARLERQGATLRRLVVASILASLGSVAPESVLGRALELLGGLFG